MYKLCAYLNITTSMYKLCVKGSLTEKRHLQYRDMIASNIFLLEYGVSIFFLLNLLLLEWSYHIPLKTYHHM